MNRYSTPSHGGIPRPLRRYASLIVIAILAWFGLTWLGYGIAHHVVPLAVKGIREARKALPSAQPTKVPEEAPVVSWPPTVPAATATVSAFEVDPPTCTCNSIVRITAQGQVASKDVTYAIEHEIPKAGGVLCFKPSYKNNAAPKENRRRSDQSPDRPTH